jgi:hypothetical protein
MQLVLQQVYTMKKKIYIFRSDENQPDRGNFQFFVDRPLLQDVLCRYALCDVSKRDFRKEAAS